MTFSFGLNVIIYMVESNKTQDIKSNFRFIYAKKGDELLVVKESIDVWIVEDSKCTRFSCHFSKLSLTPPDIYTPEEVIIVKDEWKLF